MPGELVLTAGWGRTGYKEGPSKQLRRLELEVTSVDDLWVFTGVTNSRGQLVDSCEGDSGGPLLVQREGQWPYLIFVIFFPQPQFEVGKFYT